MTLTVCLGPSGDWLEVKIGYARVSTSEQELSPQLSALEAFGCERIFRERASGTKAERPQLEAALDYCREGDVFVVWKLDRCARYLKDLIEKLCFFRQRSVKFVSLTESLEIPTPSGRLVFHLMAAIAEFERDLIRERTLARLTAARARGRKGGRKPAMDQEKVSRVETRSWGRGERAYTVDNHGPRQPLSIKGCVARARKNGVFGLFRGGRDDPSKNGRFSCTLRVLLRACLLQVWASENPS